MKLFKAIMMCLFGLTANAEKISLEDRVSELEA